VSDLEWQDGPDDDPDGIAWLDPEPVEAATVDCWRCGKPVAIPGPACPFCRAALSHGAGGPGPLRVGTGTADDSGRFMPVFYLFAAFLATSVVYGWTVRFGLDEAAPNKAGDFGGRIVGLVVVELIDTALVVAGIFWASRPPPPPERSPRQRLVAWAVAVVGLVLLLAVNIGYHRLLRDALGVPDLKIDLFARPEWTAWIILTICVQPAVVEELFFRYLALGHLRPLLGNRGAVVVSAVMFGFAHLFALLSTPYLVLAGIVFGYTRLCGRSLALPIFLHFAHNLAVLWLDSWL
jgi:membrane protease YdiL (CAAX protease family)